MSGTRGEVCSGFAKTGNRIYMKGNRAEWRGPDTGPRNRRASPKTPGGSSLCMMCLVYSAVYWGGGTVVLETQI